MSIMKFGVGHKSTQSSYRLFSVVDKNGRQVKVQAMSKAHARQVLNEFDNREPIKKRSR